MPKQRVEIVCPHCQRKWWHDLSQDPPGLPLCRGAPTADEQTERRVKCPSCGIRFVVTTRNTES